MYDVILDEDGYWTGSYTASNKKSKLTVEILPDERNPKLKTAYKLGSIETTVERQIPAIEYYIESTQKNADGTIKTITTILSDEDEKLDNTLARIKTDNKNNVIYTTETTTVQIKSLVKDPDKYHALLLEIIEEKKKKKKSELGNICSSIIYAGTDVTFPDKTIKHFSLTVKDQIKINMLYMQALQGQSPLYWHPDNGYSQIFTREEMLLTGHTCLTFITCHDTLINHLNRYIESLASEEEINAVTYSPDSLKGEALEKYTETMNTLLLTPETPQERMDT